MSHIGRTSRRFVVCSGILLGAVVLLGLVPWRLVAAEAGDDARRLAPIHQALIRIDEGELQFSSPTLSNASVKGRHFYQAHLRVSEGKDGQPESRLSVPTIHYGSGQGAFASGLLQNDKTRLWVVTLSAPDEGKPALGNQESDAVACSRPCQENRPPAGRPDGNAFSRPNRHTMQVTLLSNPSGKELPKEEQESLVRMLYKTFLTARRCVVSKEQGTRVAMPDGYASIQCDAEATADTYGPQRIPECVLWRSPEVTFAGGATGKIAMTRNDGIRLTIEMTVSPGNSPTGVAAASSKNGSQQ